jgi:ABC-type glycerol-3-phosphate transport system substrate-binding protein
MEGDKMRNTFAFALLVSVLGLSACGTSNPTIKKENSTTVKAPGEEVEVMDVSTTETDEVTIDSSNTTKETGTELSIVEEEVPAKVTRKKKKGGSGESPTTKKGK